MIPESFFDKLLRLQRILSLLLFPVLPLFVPRRLYLDSRSALESHPCILELYFEFMCFLWRSRLMKWQSPRSIGLNFSRYRLSWPTLASTGRLLTTCNSYSWASFGLKTDGVLEVTASNTSKLTSSTLIKWFKRIRVNQFRHNTTRTKLLNVRNLKTWSFFWNMEREQDSFCE